MQHIWRGVFPAITTKFTLQDSLDLEAMERHIRFQLEAGVHGIIVCGSLGESATLSTEEKLQIVKLAASVCEGKVPVVATIAENATASACRFAELAAAEGADGFMLLPGLLYDALPNELMHHLRAVAAATDLPIMIYNNPVSYKNDISPAMFAELADEPKFVAIKESSDDVRRITDLRNAVGDRYAIFSGVDNIALESLLLGADGWVAGLVCAFPHETVALYNMALEGRLQEARQLYQWFMPLLHLDVSARLVQNIKLAEMLVGIGSEWVRAPRLPLVGPERDRVITVIETALANRPQVLQGA